MDNIDLIINCLINNKPIIFLKYGDGEYICASRDFNFLGFEINKNCDQDNFTEKLGIRLVDSFKYIIYQNNIIIAKTFMEKIDNYFLHLSNNKIDINYSYYRQLLICNEYNKNIEIYKAIRNSKLKKIYVCNELLIKSKILLNIDHIITIPINNWFDDSYDEIFNKVKEIIGENDNNHILMTSCGMSAKVLIPEIHKLYPNGIYLDIGSYLDLICTKRDSRGIWDSSGNQVKYQEVYNIFKNENLIPDEWDDPKYNYIYEEARNKLGVHVGKIEE